MASRWVKLFEQLLQSEVFEDASPALLKVFIWCLLKANFKAGKWQGTVIERGQFVTGKTVACQEVKLPTTTWWRSMRRLESMGCISLKAEPRFTIVTVCNYETYQKQKQQGGTDVEPARNDRGTEVEPKWNPDGTQVEPIVEGKKSIREEGKKGREPRGPALPAGLDTPAFRSAWESFEAHRVEIKKPLTPKATDMSLKKLAALGHDQAIEAVEKAIANGWQGVVFDAPSRAGPGSKFPGRTQQTLNAAKEYLRRKREQETDDEQRTADGLPDGVGGCV